MAGSWFTIISTSLFTPLCLYYHAKSSSRSSTFASRPFTWRYFCLLLKGVHLLEFKASLDTYGKVILSSSLRCSSSAQYVFLPKKVVAEYKIGSLMLFYLSRGSYSLDMGRFFTEYDIRVISYVVINFDNQVFYLFSFMKFRHIPCNLYMHIS